MKRLSRLFHTVRYLRWRQVWFRLYYRVRPLRVPVAGGAIAYITAYGFFGTSCREQTTLM